MSKSTNICIWAVAVVAATLLASPTWADALLDPATLQIGPGWGTACATKGGGCPIFIGGALNGEVNNIERTRLSIFQNQTNASALDNPVLLILSVPNNDINPTALSASLYAPYNSSSPEPVTITAGTSAYGITTAASGFAGGALWTKNSNANDVYGFVGLSGTDKSNSFVNYSAAYERVMGTSVNNFGVYVFSIDTTAFAGNDLLDIQVNSGPGGLPEGTFAVAYGQDPPGQNPQHLYDTPFTQAGMVDTPPPAVPEPSSLSLFGAALVVLGLLRWRKRSFI